MIDEFSFLTRLKIHLCILFVGEVIDHVDELITSSEFVILGVTITMITAAEFEVSGFPLFH